MFGSTLPCNECQKVNNYPIFQKISQIEILNSRHHNTWFSIIRHHDECAQIIYRRGRTYLIRVETFSALIKFFAPFFLPMSVITMQYLELGRSGRNPLIDTFWIFTLPVGKNGHWNAPFLAPPIESTSEFMNTEISGTVESVSANLHASNFLSRNFWLQL